MSTTPPSSPAAEYHDSRDAFFDVEHIKADVGRLSGKGGSFTIASAGIKVLLLVGSTMVLSRLIPPAEFGVVALAMPVLVLATHMSQLGLAHSISQRRQVSHHLASNLFWINALIGACIGALFAGLGPLAARYFDDARVSAVYGALGLAVFAGTLVGPFLAVYWRQLRIREVEIINMLAIFISTAGAIIAAQLGASYWAIVLQQILLPVANGALLSLRMGWFPSRPRSLDLQALRECVSFGGKLALFEVLFQIAQSLGPLFAGRAFTQVQAALYYRAANLAQLPYQLMLVPLGATFISSLSRLQDDPEEFRHLFSRSLSRITLIMLPVGVALCTATTDIVLVLLGPTWLELVPMFALLGLRPILGTLSVGFRWALTAQGHSSVLSWIGLINLIAIFTAMSIGLQYGPIGLVAGGLIAETLVMGVLLGCAAVYKSTLEGRDVVQLLGETLFYGATLAATSYGLGALTAAAPLGLRIGALVMGFIVVLIGRVLVQKSLRDDALRILRAKTRS